MPTSPPSSPQPSPRRNLPQLLGDARRWFEEALLTAMNAAGGPPVTSAQVQLFAWTRRARRSPHSPGAWA
ncbi:hypothetical protein [Streptomyces chrestomyceticus]|uniref:hypothetical protein n=1 Tax=Streptomyces chrestomyceticus TaxID=68185 RepID=UPI003F4D5ABF